MSVRKMPQAPAVRTAKVKILKGVVIGPGCDAEPGEIFEVPKYIASQFVSNGQAIYTDEGDPSEHDDPGAAAHVAGYSTVIVEKPTNRDPQPKKKG
jgi:hypothetical protein